MRASLVLAALAFPLAAGVANAQTVQGSVAIDGSVASRCSLSINSATISVGEMSLPADGKLNAAVINGQNRNLTGFCNGSAANMTVQAQPLLNITAPAAPPAGFDNRVDYTATATANAVNGTDSSVGALSDGAPVTIGQFTGNILVTLSAASSPTSGILVAGTYQGQVLVTLKPTP
jgi:hypothetical protein